MGDFIRMIPIWLLGSLLLLASTGCAWIGSALSRWMARVRGEGESLSETQEGYLVASIFALLALLIAFTFGLAMDRYQTRRQLVVQEANAIEGVYLRSQLLDEPDRSRLSRLLIRYTENHLRLARLRHDTEKAQHLLAEDDALVRDIWTAAVPAVQRIKLLAYSPSFVDSLTDLVRTGAERKAHRRSQIPTTIIVCLFFYALVAGGALGGVTRSRTAWQLSVALMALNCLAFMLVMDLNRPVEGTIHESQEPMELMLARLKANPPAVYQRLAQPGG
jgi:hypothetical protein